MGVGEKFVPVPKQAAARHEEDEAHARAHGGHFLQLRLAYAELFNDRADILLRHVRHELFHRFHEIALLVALHKHARGRHLKLIAFAAHRLDEDRERHFAAAGDVEAVGAALDVRDAQGNVLERFAVKTVADLAAGDKLALASGERGVVDGERHFHRRRGDLHKRQRLDRADGADRVADGNVADAAHGDDVARRGFRHGDLGKAAELVERNGFRPARHGVGRVVVADGDLLVLADRAALDAPDGDAADELVIVQRGNEHLKGRGGILRRFGDILEDRVEQRLKIGALHIRRIGRRTPAARAEQHRGIELLVRGVEIHQQLQHLVHDLVNALVGAVDLVDDDDHAVAKLQRAAEYEARLRHGTFGGVHEQDDAVDHFEHTLDLAAEVGVARRVDDVDLDALVGDGGILCENGDAALAFEIAGVHHALDNLLIFAVYARLLEHFVHKRRLAVVNVGNDCDIA